MDWPQVLLIVRIGIHQSPRSYIVSVVQRVVARPNEGLINKLGDVATDSGLRKVSKYESVVRRRFVLFNCPFGVNVPDNSCFYGSVKVVYLCDVVEMLSKLTAVTNTWKTCHQR